MSTITTIQGTDVVADSRADINTNFDNLNTDKVETLSDLGITVTADVINKGSITGSIIMWPASTEPTNWLFCRGQAVSRTTYADLFTLIDTTYGVGDGSTTFNLPNLEGRVPVGYDSTQTEFDSISETGGAKTHTLTEAEMPAHTHTITTAQPSGSGINDIQRGTNLQTSTSTELTNSTGGDGAHNNLQPYIVLNFIIKT